MFLSDLPIRTRLWFQAARDQFHHWHPLTRSSTPARRWLELSALEERVFLSASPAGAVVPESMEVAVPVETTDNTNEGPSQNSGTGSQSPVLEVETSSSAQSNANEESAQGQDIISVDYGPILNVELWLSPEPENTAPTDISLNHTTIHENTQTENGFQVGILSAGDPDPKDTLTYSIQGGADASKFSIEDGWVKRLLLTDGKLDFETQSSYEVILRVTDSANNIYDELFTITVIDQHELATFTLEENSPAGTFVGTIAASDPEAGDGSTYEIVGGRDKDSFTLDATTGELFVANPERLDYDRWRELEFIVRVTDSQGAIDQGLVHVSLTNISIPPIAVDDVEGGPPLFFFRNEDFTRNDISPEGEKLVVIGFADLGGARIIDNGDLTYTFFAPEGVTEGQLSFTYFVQDRSGNVASATMTVILEQITPHNPDHALPDVLPIFPNAVPQTPLRPVTSAPVLAPVPMAQTPDALSVSQTSDLVNQREAPDALPSNPPMVLLAAAAPGSLPHRETGVFFAAPNEGEDVFQAVFLESNPEATLPQILTVAHSPGEMRAWSAESSAWNSHGSSTSTLPDSPASAPENDPVVIDLSPGGLVWQDLDTMQEDLQSQMDFQTMVVGAAVTVSSTLTVGYVLWMVRGGVLVGSLLAQMPAWRFVDPLPILEHLDQSLDDADDQESLEAIIANTQFAW